MTTLQYVPIVSLILSISIALMLGYPLALALAATVAITFIIVKRLGYSCSQQIRFGLYGVMQTKPVLLILSLVGVLIPLFMMSGTIPGIIYYGLEIVNVNFLLIIAFLLTSTVSYLLGTSVGTLSTVGLSLIGIAHAAQMPLGMMAGALISGAMVGERFSPVSSSRLLTISSIDGDERIDTFARKTGIVGFVLTAVLFFLLDLWRVNGSASEAILNYQSLLASYFNVSFVVMSPLVVLIVSFLLRVKAIPSLFLGIIASFLLMLFNRPMGLEEFGKSMLFGYDLRSGTALDALVHGGGMINILNVLALITLAGFLNGILNQTNLLKPIVDKLMGRTGTLGSLVAKSVALSLFVIVISCNQTIPLLVLGNTLITRFSQFADGKEWLGRTMLDATLVMPVLVPWNGLAMVMSVTLGVQTVDSLLFMLFPLILPIVTIMFAFIQAPKKTGELSDQTNKAS